MVCGTLQYEFWSSKGSNQCWGRIVCSVLSLLLRLCQAGRRQRCSHAVDAWGVLSPTFLNPLRDWGFRLGVSSAPPRDQVQNPITKYYLRDRRLSLYSGSLPLVCADLENAKHLVIDLTTFFGNVLGSIRI